MENSANKRTFLLKLLYGWLPCPIIFLMSMISYEICVGTSNKREKEKKRLSRASIEYF